MSDDEDTYEIPLQDQRIFGAGIKRKRVKFVPSTSTIRPTPPSNSSGKSVSERYLDLVLRKQKLKPEATSSSATEDSNVEQADENPASEVCEICKLPLADIALESASVETTSPSSPEPTTLKRQPHEASIAHQLCLPHSHPPSHLDRSRKGLAYLSAYGWDPDARLGLGAAGQGIQFPIKMKPNEDKLGIGVILPKDVLAGKRLREKQVKLDAGKVRKLEARDKKRTEQLRDMLYRSEDVDRYLSGN